MVKNPRVKVLWDFKVQTVKQLLAKKSDIQMVDKEQKTTIMIDVAIPWDSNIRKKEYTEKNGAVPRAEGIT